MTGYRLLGERSKHLRQPGRAPFELLSAAVHVLRRSQHQRRAVFPRLALRPRGEKGQPARAGDVELTAHVHRSAAAGEAISTTAKLASSAPLTAFSQSSVPGTSCSLPVQTATPAVSNRFANRRTTSTSTFANDRKTCVRIASMHHPLVSVPEPNEEERDQEQPPDGLGRVWNRYRQFHRRLQARRLRRIMRLWLTKESRRQRICECSKRH